MFWYFMKLLVLLPLLGVMIYGSLWLWRKYQPNMLGAQGDRSIKILEMLPMGTFGKLAVVEFDGKRLLVSVTRGRIEKLAESDGDPASGGGVRHEASSSAADLTLAGQRKQDIPGTAESPYRARY